MGAACGTIGTKANFHGRSPTRVFSEELAVLTRKILCLKTLEVEPSEAQNWQTLQTLAVQDFVQNPVLSQLRQCADERLTGDPSILEFAGEYHLFVPCTRGIVHLASGDGLSNWTITELAVDEPGAVCPFVRIVEGVAHLFYEQRGSSTFQSAAIFLKTASVASDSVPASAASPWCWSEPRKVLEPELEWEKVGMSRVGNPYVVYDEKAARWLLYYSASVTFLSDARLDEPMFIGVTEAPALEGPYHRLRGTPLFRTASDIHPQIIGAGSFKMIQGFDTLGDSTHRKMLALQSRLTRTVTGITGSSIALLASADGLSWNVVDAHFLTPTQRPGWNMAYMLSFDTIMPSSDANHVFLYYHASEAPGSNGCVGVSRIQKSLLEQLACSQATRVTACGPALAQPSSD